MPIDYKMLNQTKPLSYCTKNKEIIDTYLDAPDFHERGKVHDWRNYVPKTLQEDWDILTDREKGIIISLCNDSYDLYGLTDEEIKRVVPKNVLKEKK